MDKHSPEKKATSLLERRNKAFRVLYNTVIEVTQAEDCEIFRILCRNLREICDASFAALAKIDPVAMTATLQNIDFADAQASLSADKEYYADAQQVAQFVSSFDSAIIKEYTGNEYRFTDLFSELNIDAFIHGDDTRMYHFTCAKGSELLAIGMVAFADNQRMKMKDMVDTYLGLASVIIQRANAIKELNISKQWFQKLLNSSPVGIMVVDDNRKIVEINDSSLTMIGQKRDDVIGKNCKELICMDNNQKCPIFDENKIVDQEEKLFLRDDGQAVPVLKNAIPITIDDKMYLIETIVDISELKKAEENLRKSEETFKSIFDGANDAIFIHAIPGGNIVTVNDKATEMLGYSKDEFPDMTINEITSGKAPFTGYEAISYLHKAMHEPQIFEWNLKRKNGDVFWVEVNLKKVTILGEERIMAIVRDITERRKMEDELLKARKLESVGILAGGIAHDFNNLLTVIIGNISVAQMDITDATSSSAVMLDNAHKAAMRAKDLSTQLLTFSKGGEPVKHTTLIKDLVMESVGFVLKGSNVKCKFDIPCNLHPVEVDEGQISQVIYNLVINADQAMPAGGTITVSCENVVLPAKLSPTGNAGNNYVKISIADQGIGIPDTIIDKIFDPYFTTKDKGAIKGTGLGLSTCYSIVKNHGGMIDVESKVHKGTVFHVYLPVSSKNIDKTDHTPQKKEIVNGSGRILVMDDEPMVRMVVGDILKHLGYEPDYASDGAEAMDKFEHALQENQPYDALIMDLTIPGGMGGKETIKRLQELYPDVKAIVSSGYSNDPVMAHYEQYGFRGVVNKPVTIDQLSSTLHEIIH